MNKTDKIKLSVLVIFTFLVAALISLSFGFFVGKSTTQGNVVYWIFKGIMVGWIALEAVLLAISGHVRKHLPIMVTGLALQGIPALMRIGFVRLGRPYIGIIIVCSIILLIFISASVLFGIGSDISKRAEDRAKPSSNAGKYN